MPSSATLCFTDPDAWGQAVRNSNVELTPVGRGRFTGEIVAINLQRVWMQRMSDDLPRVICATNVPGRVIINFRAQPGPPLQTGGVDLLPHTILRYAEGQTIFQRSEGATVFCAMLWGWSERKRARALAARLRSTSGSSSTDWTSL